MSDLYQFALLFLNPIALITLLLLTYRIPVISSLGDFNRQLLFGVISAIVVCHVMLNPLIFSDGTRFDVRCLLVGITVAFFGIRAGIITLIAAVSMRFYMGGVGTTAGVAALGAGFAGALLWQLFVRPRVQTFAARSVSLGLMISLHILAMFLLPREIWTEIAASFIPFFLTSNVAGVALIGAIVERDKYVRSLKNELVRDPLTGLFNRRRAEQYFEDAATRPERDKVTSIIYFDLDKFKGINDEYGHGVGDEVLRQVTSSIQAELRPTDLFCRLGGDEFAIILDNIDPDDLVQIADRCRHVVSDLKIAVEGTVIRPTISVGVSRQVNTHDFKTAFDAADVQLYRAKQAGRNRLAYDPNIVHLHEVKASRDAERFQTVRALH